MINVGGQVFGMLGENLGTLGHFWEIWGHSKFAHGFASNFFSGTPGTFLGHRGSFSGTFGDILGHLGTFWDAYWDIGHGPNPNPNPNPNRL